ncbi:MAG: heavy metal translocating P-type ATPase [Clostridiales bacterium]|nr:heavy metal translocating P-type ATPase [Clostridiales bacterium]
MQRLILRNKRPITLISAILVSGAYTSHYLLHQEPAAQVMMLIASVIGVLPIALQAYQALRVKVVSIDVLVTIAVVGALIIGNYEESAVVTFLFLFGDYLELRTLNKTRSAIRELTEMAPESALKMMEDGSYQEVDIDEVDVGDSLRVLTGAKIPVDGQVVSGEGHVNEASITGEAVPVGKQAGDQVFAGTILDNGTLHITADRVGEDTTFGRIIQLVEEAQDAKSEAERFIDRFAKWYTPAVLVLAFIVWLVSRNIELAITILVLGCPGALVIGVPVSNVAGIGNGARQGVLLKGSEVIHDFSRVDTMVFDKTGTLTIGHPEVAQIKMYGEDQEETQSLLYSVESQSDHPLARAIVKHLAGAAAHDVEQTDVVKGGGILAQVKGRRVAVGNMALMRQEGVTMDEQARQDAAAMERAGHSIVLTGVDGQLRALVGIRDQLRPGVGEDLGRLRRMGVKNLVLLSGDNQGTVDLVASELGLTQAHGHMLPEDKAAYIKDLQQQGHIVAFVGDGVNDSPSLALAQIGIAMGSGTDVAIETSEVVLMNSDFGRLPHALGLARATARNMRQNIVIAVGVVLVLLFSLFFSSWMNMSIGMLVHEASILVVILNGMRLLRYRLRPR